MINLLPDDAKRDIRAARTNVMLLRYNVVTLVSVGGLLLICLVFYVVLSANQQNADSLNSDSQSKAATYERTRKEAEEYKDNLKTAKTILDNNVNYSSTVFAIAELLPAGTKLDSITLSKADFGKQISFSAHAKSYDQAMKLKQNFQESKLFTNVFFQNVSDTRVETTEGAGAYPVSILLSAQLKKVTTP